MYRQLRPATRRPSASAAIAVAWFEKADGVPEAYAELDRETGGALTEAAARPDFSAAKGGVTLLTARTGAARRVYVLGLGPREKFTAEALRIAAAKLVRLAFAAKLTEIDLRLAGGVADTTAGRGAAGDQTASARAALDDDALGRAVGDGLAIANFEFDRFKGAGKAGDADAGGKEVKAKGSAPLDLQITIDPAYRDGLARGLRIGESVNLARELAATPPNVANPGYLVDACRRMAREVGLKCTIIDAARAKALGMGGLVAVGSAGSSPPALICLEHAPRDQDDGSRAGRGRGKVAQAGGGPLLLVGKAVTFDTGGYSIKPAENMDKMKYDKCGGMAVIGAMHAIARLDLPLHVVGLIPAAENMVSERAYRPGDILTFCNGVTAEVTNTDAEGRLILADALAYGTREYKPRAVVDLATLTGGVVVALGTACAGAFCGDPSFRGHLFDAAEYTGERLWHLPLWEEHRQQIKGTHGDIVNSAGRDAHPIQGAAFLSYFIEPDGKRGLPALPWCHLDIAGVADVKKDTPLYATGPTGFGVRLLVRAAETWDALPRRD